MPFVLPSATLSKGSRRLHPAVRAKIAAEVNTGKFGDTANRKPADTGAITPVLPSQPPMYILTIVTYNLDKAADVPHAVPLIDVPNVSGVIPSVLVSGIPGPQDRLDSHKTAYMAVAAAEMNIELTITAQSCSTRMKAKVDRLVKIVQIARDFLLPRRV
jgi:hypothetical protein